MSYKIRLFPSIWRQIYLLTRLPYISLLIWLLPLLICNSGQSSLMAHDEGYYAGRARQMFDSGDWIAPWGTAHHKTPGPYWLIATAYNLFGVSEFSARFPSAIASILALFILYEIGKIIVGKKVAWLAATILSVEFLWLQSSRLAAPDIPMILLVLLAILSLLKAELNPKYSDFLLFIAGLCFGLGFLTRSFMILLPMVALLPYLIKEHHRHHHLANLRLYLGLAVGLIPVLAWLWLSWLRYGAESFGQLLGFVVELGSEDRNHNGILFYFWNIPLKSFPWFFFAILGLIVVLRRPIANYQLILVGFPLVLFTELSIFSTRLSHYALGLYPFMALLAAVGLDWLGKIYQCRQIDAMNRVSTSEKLLIQNNNFLEDGEGITTIQPRGVRLLADKRASTHNRLHPQRHGVFGHKEWGMGDGEEITNAQCPMPNAAGWLSLFTQKRMKFPAAFNKLLSWMRKAEKNLPRNLSYGIGILGILLIAVSIFALVSQDAYIRDRTNLGFILGLGWLIVPVVWIARHRFGQKFLTENYWFASWLIPCWLTLATAGSLGLLSDYNPTLKAFFQDPAIASILQTHPVSFVQVYDKNSVLLHFYTPIPGQEVDSISQLPTSSYAWIYKQQNPQLSTSYRILATLQEYQLIQVLP
ncbi:glycosyltransferase family 39 protein [Tolypothrix sp. PCC 7910]|uniref:ArnT family glycosyltransferase n=1 Tax=Tolypothrix sp. PCC 7910 TaxID=2099387 RepID=UPI001FCA781F|nr:glycosyltransferase family 39 protein [Tolypothrix sp. PCC 7910]